jgi:hypothetical protein
MRLAALALLALLALAPAARADVEVGFNQGWTIDHWGRDLTTDFDPAAWRRVLEQTRAAGGRVLRVWLCEGVAKEGVVWDGTRALTVDPAFLVNVQTLIDLARQTGVELYWTLFDGNWPDSWPQGGLEAWRHYNILQDKYGEGALFRQNVLAPLLDVIAPAADVTWGLDLMNEVQGSVKTWKWSDGWSGARRWIAAWAAFVHTRAPGLRVTASSGWADSADDLIDGRFAGLGLDFWDLHVYADSGRIPRGWTLALHAAAEGVPLVLGEYGQKSTKVDPTLQARVTGRFLRDARRYGLAAALAWRVEDFQSNGLQFTFFERDGRPRPAVDVVRRFAARVRP